MRVLRVLVSTPHCKWKIQEHEILTVIVHSAATPAPGANRASPFRVKRTRLRRFPLRLNRRRSASPRCGFFFCQTMRAWSALHRAPACQWRCSQKRSGLHRALPAVRRRRVLARLPVPQPQQIGLLLSRFQRVDNLLQQIRPRSITVEMRIAFAVVIVNLVGPGEFTVFD
jgi:hypothetical protein